MLNETIRLFIALILYTTLVFVVILSIVNFAYGVYNEICDIAHDIEEAFPQTERVFKMFKLK